MNTVTLDRHDWYVILMALQVAANHWEQPAKIGASFGENKLSERVSEFRELADRIRKNVGG